MKDRYKIIREEWNTATGTTKVTINTDCGAFTGQPLHWMCSILTTRPPGKSFRYSLSPCNTHTNLFTFMKSFYSICTFIIQRGSLRFLTSQHHSHKWDSNSVLSGSPFPVLLRQKSTSCSECQVRSWCPGKDRPPRPRHRVPANDLTRDASDSLSLRKPSRA